MEALRKEGCRKSSSAWRTTRVLTTAARSLISARASDGKNTLAIAYSILTCLERWGPTSVRDHRCRPLLHAMVSHGVPCTWGVELDKVKCDKAAAFCQHVLGNLVTKGESCSVWRWPAYERAPGPRAW